MINKRHKSVPQNEENIVIQLLSKYLTYWPLFLVFLVLSVAGAFVYLRYATPLYEATASLIIKDEKKGYDDSKLVESLNMISTKKIIENEVEVLQSKPLIKNVVLKLHLYVHAFQDGKIKPRSAYNNGPVLISALNPDSLETSNKIYIKYNAVTGMVTLNNKFSGPINEWVETPYGTLKFTPNKKYIPEPQDKPYYFTLAEPNNVTLGILESLNVSASSKFSSVINLSYSATQPDLAEDVLNALLSAYNDASLNEKNILARNTLNFIEQRLTIVGKTLDSIEKKVEQYKSGTGAVDISKQGGLFLENVSENDQKLSEINMQLSVINQLEKYVSSNDNNSGILPSNLGLSDPTLTNMITNLNEAELEHTKLKNTVAENNPMLVSLTEKINKLKPNILQNIQNQRKSLESNRSSLYTTNGSYNSILHTIPQKEKELLEISRNQAITSDIYSFLLQKREESELSSASTLTDSRVVNLATAPNRPVSPKKKLILAGALLTGLLIPIAFIYARELLSRNVLYRKDLESLTSIPVIGEIAYNKLAHPFVEAGKRSFIAEEFRKIRFSLLNLGIDATNRKKVLVTSSLSGEGKSFVAANLAISFSLTGKKVVLIDMDLHDPSLEKMFSKEDEPGVSDFLTGAKKIEDIITLVPGNENLFFISSGTRQEDASELLENGKIQQLIAALNNSFDLVVIDTSPVGMVTDAYVLSACCDTTLYIVRHMYTPKMLIKRFDENNVNSPLLNPAIVFNGVKTRGYIKNNYGYGYGYVYGDKKDLSKKKDKKKDKKIKTVV